MLEIVPSPYDTGTFLGYFFLPSLSALACIAAGP
jgi:hypothetical protein